MGLDLELLSAQLPPIRTSTEAPAALPDYGGAVQQHHDEEEEVPCSTPTAAANVLRPPPVCPLAPRKPRPRQPGPRRRKKKHSHCCCYYYCGRRGGGAPALWRSSLSFVAVPDDLAKVFVPRRPAASTAPCRQPPDSKKIRVHVVG